MFLSKVMSLWGYLQVSLFLLACFCCAYFFITGEVIRKLFSETAFFFVLRIPVICFLIVLHLLARVASSLEVLLISTLVVMYTLTLITAKPGPETQTQILENK